ncbi:putative FYVE zinc finger, Zinc finger, FYVE/PHD-type, Zinc finger, RING/FYVE/PHD-type [Plasmopara halstedii]
MATELPFPLYSGFFPQVVLTIDEIMHYRRLGKERVSQLMRIIDDADCIYRWTDLKARNNRIVQKAQFWDIQLNTKQPVAQQPSIIFKSSAHLVDVQTDEILEAIAKVKTRDARRASSYLYGDNVVDTQTLLTFPTSSEQTKPNYSYRAVKWCLLRNKRKETSTRLDFCYLEYAGKKKDRSAPNSVVGFCIQESIAKDREVPTLERYDILRGQFVRTGFLITKTRQTNILKVTAIAQVDGALESAAVRVAMEEIMVNYVTAVHRVKGLLERQRMGRLQYLDEWNWVSSKERKACAVCLRSFYFHRKYHCTTCGEVVCSTCAPLRELDEPLNEHTHSLRVCSVCMAQAGSRASTSMFSGVTRSEDGFFESTTQTTNINTDTYMNGLRYPKHRELPKEESLHHSTLRFTPEHSLWHFSGSSHSSNHHDGYKRESDGNLQYQRTSIESIPRGRNSTTLQNLKLTSRAVSTEAKRKAVTRLVENVRQICDTINVAILEAEEENERHSMMLQNGQRDDIEAERYDELYDCLIKIRELLDTSSSDIDDALVSIGGNKLRRPLLDHSNGALALSFTKDVNSTHSSESKSDRLELHSPRSSLLSASARSLDHQNAGEPLPSPRPTQLNVADDSRLLAQAIRWARQPEPTVSTHLNEPASLLIEPAVANLKSPRIERLARKIGRLCQRLETVQREIDIPLVREKNTEDEPEPENQVTSDFVQKPHQAIASTSIKCGSSGPRAPPDLVASLRGVMNSSELTHAPPRQRTALSSSANESSKIISPSGNPKRAPPPPCPAVPPALPTFSSRTSASRALTPHQGTTIYVHEPQDQLQRVRRRGLDKPFRMTIVAKSDLNPVQSRNDHGEQVNIASLDEEQEDARNHGESTVPPRSNFRFSRYGDREGSEKLRESIEEMAKTPLRSRCASGQSTGAPPSEKFDI